jgi:hypothetical protein
MRRVRGGVPIDGYRLGVDFATSDTDRTSTSWT